MIEKLFDINAKTIIYILKAIYDGGKFRMESNYSKILSSSNVRKTWDSIIIDVIPPRCMLC